MADTEPAARLWVAHALNPCSIRVGRIWVAASTFEEAVSRAAAVLEAQATRVSAEANRVHDPVEFAQRVRHHLERTLIELGDGVLVQWEAGPLCRAVEIDGAAEAARAEDAARMARDLGDHATAEHQDRRAGLARRTAELHAQSGRPACWICDTVAQFDSAAPAAG